ncbi:MAG: hypothetical protein H6Q20_2069 [Bacteroidetes bacterium]|nr:hypothetical protein [Bacteroidota bacterium]
MCVQPVELILTTRWILVQNVGYHLDSSTIALPARGSIIVA